VMVQLMMVTVVVVSVVVVVVVSAVVVVASGVLERGPFFRTSSHNIAGCNSTADSITSITVYNYIFVDFCCSTGRALPIFLHCSRIGQKTPHVRLLLLLLSLLWLLLLLCYCCCCCGCHRHCDC